MSTGDGSEGQRRASLLVWCGWLPPVSWLGVDAYAARFDGWGGLGTAPLYLLPVALSAVFVLAGFFALRGERAAGGMRPGTVAGAALASLPLLWFLYRLLLYG